MSGLKQAVRNTAKIIMFKGVYPLCYKVSSLRPLRKNKVIFAEIRSGTLTDSFRYIYEEIKTRGLDPQVYYVHNNKGGMGYLLRYLKLTWLMGTAIGLMIHLGDKIQKGAGMMQNVASKIVTNKNTSISEEEFMTTLVTVIVLFCASGTGIYGSIVSGMTDVFALDLYRKINGNSLPAV